MYINIYVYIYIYIFIKIFTYIFIYIHIYSFQLAEIGIERMVAMGCEEVVFPNPTPSSLPPNPYLLTPNPTTILTL
jgi:hypothetical protein